MQKVAPTTLTMGLVTWTHKSSLELKENAVIIGTVQFCSFSRVFLCGSRKYRYSSQGRSFFLIPRGGVSHHSKFARESMGITGGKGSNRKNLS